jgi:hypothetical protein
MSKPNLSGISKYLTKMKNKFGLDIIDITLHDDGEFYDVNINKTSLPEFYTIQMINSAITDLFVEADRFFLVLDSNSPKLSKMYFDGELVYDRKKRQREVFVSDNLLKIFDSFIEKYRQYINVFVNTENTVTLFGNSIEYNFDEVEYTIYLVFNITSDSISHNGRKIDLSKVSNEDLEDFIISLTDLSIQHHISSDLQRDFFNAIQLNNDLIEGFFSYANFSNYFQLRQIGKFKVDDGIIGVYVPDSEDVVLNFLQKY